MKAHVNIVAGFVAAFACVALGASAAFAQTGAAAPTAATRVGRLQLDSLERLAPKATDTLNIQMDASLIEFASKLLSEDDPDEREVRKLIVGLRGVYVRRLGFGAEGQYAESDIAPVREQLRAPGWSRIVDIESRGAGFERAEIYLATEGGRVEGLALLAVEPKEIVVINIVGSIDLQQLKKLEGTLGIPRITIRRKNSVNVKTKPPVKKQ
jgi:hypothetical protein